MTRGLKKTLSLLLAFSLILSLCACFADGDKGAQDRRLKIKCTSFPFYKEFTDNDRESYNSVMSGRTVTFEVDGEAGYLYICFRNEPFPWTLEYSGVSSVHGENGFYHELVRLPEGVSEFSMTFSCPQWQTICEIEAYSRGELPDGLQDWLPPLEKADLLVLPTHSDDECVFLGGVIPKYIDAGYSVQVAYLVNHRANERLDSLWEAGVRHYPAVADRYDVYPGSPEEARAVYGLDYTCGYLSYWIRRVQPSVIVGQGLHGDSGHPAHIFYVDCLTRAVELAADESYRPENCKGLGAWNTPKTYLHQYGDNPTVLDYETPLESFGGRTAFRVAEDAFAKCVSQISAGRYKVYDTGSPYDSHIFGLYRSLVGEDVNRDDLFENIG